MLPVTRPQLWCCSRPQGQISHVPDLRKDCGSLGLSSCSTVVFCRVLGLPSVLEVWGLSFTIHCSSLNARNPACYQDGYSCVVVNCHTHVAVSVYQYTYTPTYTSIASSLAHLFIYLSIYLSVYIYICMHAGIYI